MQFSLNLKIHDFFLGFVNNVYKEKMFTIEMEDGRNVFLIGVVVSVIFPT